MQAENAAVCSAGALPRNSHGSYGKGGGGRVAVEGGGPLSLVSSGLQLSNDGTEAWSSAVMFACVGK